MAAVIEGRCILGVDPGSRRTGYGVVTVRDRAVEYVSSGCIRAEAGDMPQRLGTIYRGVRELIEQFQPSEVAIEEVFLAKNPASALKLGQARGVAIAAAVASELPVSEYAARRVKQSIVGLGGPAKNRLLIWLGYYCACLERLRPMRQMRLRLHCATSILANSSDNRNNPLIGRLTGALIEIDAENASLMLDVGGVGYELEVSANVLAAAPQIEP